MAEKNKQEKSLHKIISHPTRRAILEYLSQHQKATFSELSTIESKPGALYYHLNLLRGLVEQDKSKRYFLTDLGKYAVSIMHKGTIVSVPKIDTQKKSFFHSLIWNYFSFNFIFHKLSNDLKLSGIIAILLSSLMSLVFYESSIHLILILLDLYAFEDFYFALLHTLLNWLALFLIIALVVFFVLKIRIRSLYLSLFLLLPFSFLPLAFYGIFVLLFLPILYLPDLFLVILFIVNLWSLWILTTCIRVSMKLSIRYASILSLYVAYISMAVLFFIKVT